MIAAEAVEMRRNLKQSNTSFAKVHCPALERTRLLGSLPRELKDVLNLEIMDILNFIKVPKWFN